LSAPLEWGFRHPSGSKPTKLLPPQIMVLNTFSRLVK
jgi:hypothetical protein